MGVNFSPAFSILQISGLLVVLHWVEFLTGNLCDDGVESDGESCEGWSLMGNLLTEDPVRGVV